MSRKIRQFRFYGNGDSRNVPGGALVKDYQTGEVFAGVFPIAQLGIQGPPGTKFYLNGSVNPITIGYSGIYDLDIKNGSRVTGLEFDKTTLERITPETSNYLIVDILYGEEG